jgi:gamma-glutamyltranspeptidase/glutathione hydrolase
MPSQPTSITTHSTTASLPLVRRQWLQKIALQLSGIAALNATNPILLPASPLTSWLPQESSSTNSNPQTVTAIGQNVAASVHPLATGAAMNAYRQGGNAIDAAIAAALTLSVVDGHNSGIGGGCLAIVRTSTGQLLALDGREMAPRLATQEMFLRNGKPDGNLSQTGPLAVATPGQVAALFELSAKFGKLKWSQLFESPIRFAEEGFAIDRVLSSRISNEVDNIKKFPETAKILLKANGEPYREGDVLRQIDLANTMKQLASSGIDWFYRGPFAQRIGKWMQQNGGILSEQDFADYRFKYREPLDTSYRGYRVIGMPPPSSGGIHIAQMLYMLEEFDLPAIWKSNPADAYHLLLEAMQLAFADRAHWLGDADFVKVPKGLIARDYCRQLASKISTKAKSKVASHGTPSDLSQTFSDDRKHTTHLTTADRDGNWVAITSTVNTTFGSKVIVPGTGVVLNNEMDDFSIAPGTPNAFGLVGSANNAVAPGKRPLSSMSPTLVLNSNNEPLLSCGAAGGPKIITAVLRVLIGVLDQKLSATEAIAAPRVHHQWQPDESLVEERMPAEISKQLASFGHPIRSVKASAIAQAIVRTADGRLEAASDPRVPSSAAAI